MTALSKNLQPFIKNDIDLYRLSQILQDEEYIDENRKPLMCQYCDSEEFEKHHKIETTKIPDYYYEQIKEIYPDLENQIITFWVCKKCDNVVAVKLYSHKSHQEKKIYYTKFDSFHQIIKDLKAKNYLEEDNEPCQCWYCQSDKIKIKQGKENRTIATCEDCGKVLGVYYDNVWRILVETDIA